MIPQTFVTATGQQTCLAKTQRRQEAQLRPLSQPLQDSEELEKPRRWTPQPRQATRVASYRRDIVAKFRRMEEDSWPTTRSLMLMKSQLGVILTPLIQKSKKKVPKRMIWLHKNHSKWPLIFQTLKTVLASSVLVWAKFRSWKLKLAAKYSHHHNRDKRGFKNDRRITNEKTVPTKDPSLVITNKAWVSTSHLMSSAIVIMAVKTPKSQW